MIDTLEANADRFEHVRIHQMHALYDRPYLHGQLRPSLGHVSYFLSPVTRPAYLEGGLDLRPSNFSEVPAILRSAAEPSLVLAAAAPPDRHGYFSLGTSCDYTASFIGEIPFFLEVNPQMPRSWGRNQIHISQIAGWCEVDRPLIEVEPQTPTAARRRHRLPRRRTHPRRRDHPGRHRRHPQRDPRDARRTTSTSGSTPSCSPTG